ncbi:transposase [Ureaplasma urealyticum]|uniref:transposase n=1 Tax=Ureaplasma urealyticum TaxID=2130 RepID=UPI00210008D4|nr:transposase [Ureaplasma urealyticum]
MDEAIKVPFSKIIQQRCIVHLIRNNIKNVSYKYYKEFCLDLKTIYGAINLEEAQENLELFGQK